MVAKKTPAKKATPASKAPAKTPSSPGNSKKTQVTSRVTVDTGFSGGVGSPGKGARGWSSKIDRSGKGATVSPNMLPAGKPRNMVTPVEAAGKAFRAYANAPKNRATEFPTKVTRNAKGIATNVEYKGRSVVGGKIASKALKDAKKKK